jgi:putative FmdB family regulatory protein
MPVYEFQCNACSARISLFFRSINSEVSGVCERCGSSDLRRLVSRFAVQRPRFNPETLNQAELTDGLDESDPRSMARFFRRMQDQFEGEPDDRMEEMVQRMERGETIDPMTMAPPDFHDHDDHDDSGGDDGFGDL